METAVLFAFTAGAVATVNPCGFALLPAWFARQIAAREGDSAAAIFLRAARNGLAAALGFSLVFGASGLLLSSGALWLGRALPYFGVAVGGGLLIAGIMALAGLRLPDSAGLNTCRRINDRHGAFGFGLSYGAVSLSCILPIFMAVMGTSLLGGGETNLVSLLAFILGASSVLIVVALLAVVSGTGLKIGTGLSSGLIRRISGLLVAAAGGYIFIYWGRSFFDVPQWMQSILDEGAYFASSLNLWLSDRSALTILAAALLLVSAGVWLAWRLGDKRAGTGQ